VYVSTHLNIMMVHPSPPSTSHETRWSGLWCGRQWLEDDGDNNFEGELLSFPCRSNDSDVL